MILAGTMFIMTLTSGCGKKTVDDYIDNNQINHADINPAEESHSDDDYHDTEGDLAGRLGIPESCDISIDVGNSGLQSITIKDDAIEIPQTEGMSIAYYQSSRMDNAYKQTIAETFFEKSKGIYEYDSENPTKSDIERKIADLEENQELLVAQGYGESEDDAEEIAQLKIQLENAPEEYPAAGDYSGEAFIGTMNGQEYRLSFTVPPQREGADLIPQRGSLTMQNKLEYRPYEEAYDVELGGDFEKEVSVEANQCEMTPEEAIISAEDFLFRCGATDMVVTDICALEWNYYKNAWPITEYDGYVIRFDKAINQIPVFGEVEYAENLPIDWTSCIDDPTEYFVVSVDDKGIVQAGWELVCSATGEEEKNVDLLSWDEMLAAANENIAGYYEKYPSNYSDITFDEVMLSYYLVADESRENVYKYIPVWIFSERMLDSSGAVEGDQIVILNAMDGTVLDPLALAKDMGTYHEFQ